MIAWCSIGLPKPNTSNITNVTGYSSYRKISCVRTDVTVSLIVISVSGNWSPANPGSMPDAYNVALPRVAAASSCSRQSAW